MSFPEGFVWGVATSAFQIEGANGRAESIWDAFCAEPGRIRDGSDARTATGHYERWEEDVALLKELGVDVYRFSVSWPRVQPDGRGPVNAQGLDFYDRLVDALGAAGIAPMVTLYHWDLPLPLGDWLRRDTAERFAEYADAVAARLGDRVPYWATLNEPAEVTLLGHGLGQHAPGRALLFDALPAAHHQLLGHGLAVQALRARGARGVGIVNSHGPTWTAGGADTDAAAADLYDLLLNRLFSDPVLGARYPEGFADLMPGPVAEDLKLIGAPLDWYGVNYYQPTLVGAPDVAGEAEDFGGVELPPELPFGVRRIEGYRRTGFDWPVVPDGLRETLVALRERYPQLPPLYVTENGCSFPDAPGPDGRVADPERIAYLEEHIAAVATALRQGVDVRGYLVWSLLDNFEWAEGYTQRFGLVHVDYETLRRTPKDSYDWYRETVRASRAKG
jgi:beta-glucosidase